MEYLTKLKEYIDSNLNTISIPDHQLHKKFNISESKLEKDFKKFEGLTLRIYLIQLKINLALRLKQEQPSIKNIDIMAIVNYNYTEKSFRNHLKLYSGESYEYYDSSDFFLLYKNTEVFLEILVRLILSNEFAEVKMDNGKLTIKHDVKNSIFQFDQFIIPIESTHTYFISLDINTMKLNYSMFIQRLINLNEEDEEIAQVPNHISPYFNMLYNVDKIFEPHTNYRLTDCIKDWNKYVTAKKHFSSYFSDHGFYELDVHSTKDLIKMNTNAFFIKGTNSIIDKLKNRLRNEFEKVFNDKFGFILSYFNEYLKSVKEDNYKKMKSFLTSINNFDLKKIDLLIQVTCHPYIGDLNIVIMLKICIY